MSKLLIAKEPNSEKSQPKLYLVTDVLPSEIEDDQLPFCEESKDEQNNAWLTGTVFVWASSSLCAGVR